MEGVKKVEVYTNRMTPPPLLEEKKKNTTFVFSVKLHYIKTESYGQIILKFRLSSHLTHIGIQLDFNSCKY